jgi:hypothetical protein
VTPQPGGKHPWERNSYKPSPAPKERELPVRYSADVGKNYVEPATTFMNGTANNWVELPPEPLPPVTNVPPQIAAWMTGTFDTDSGVMQLTPGGGNYTQYDGALTVTTISGATMEGTWRQTNSGGQCPDGSYRGRFAFTFNEAGFSGLWSYCDAEPSKGGWSGTRRR